MLEQWRKDKGTKHKQLLEKCFNRLVFISHQHRFFQRNGEELSLITEKFLEMSGKRLVDIRIQRKTDQVKNFLQPILDTSSCARVGPHDLPVFPRAAQTVQCVFVFLLFLGL